MYEGLVEILSGLSGNPGLWAVAVIATSGGYGGGAVRVLGPGGPRRGAGDAGVECAAPELMCISPLPILWFPRCCWRCWG